MKMTSRVGSKKSAPRGFTLVELLLVIFIMGVLAAAALPNMKQTFKHYQFQSFVERFFGVLNSIHDRALIEGKVIHLIFDAEKNQYQVYDRDLSDEIRTYIVPRHIKIESDKESFNFYPDGSIDAVNITLASENNEQARLTTEGVYGQVKVWFQ